MTLYEKAARVGTTALYVIDSIGEWVARFTGITDSKFQYVIDAQNRERRWAELEAKRAEEERAAEHAAMAAAGLDPAAGQHSIELERARPLDSSLRSSASAAPTPAAAAATEPFASVLPPNIGAFARNVSASA